MKYFNNKGEEMVLVRKDWFNSLVLSQEECPFCGSDSLIQEPDDETFLGRAGCLECGKWFEDKITRTWKRDR